VLALLSGVLYALSFPLYDLWICAWVFAVPLFLSIEDAGPRESLVYGALTGIVAWAGILYWIAYVMDIYGEMSLFAASFLLLLLMVYMSMYFAVFSWAANRFIKGSGLSVLILPGIWILLELIRSNFVFSGFPWALAGHSQFSCKALIQVAEFGGVYLISGLILMMNVSVYRLMKKDLYSLSITIVLLALALVWGGWRMDTYELNKDELKVGIAQVNIEQEKKWLPEMVEPTIEMYSRLSASAVEQGARMVIWSETACNFFLFRQWEPTSKIVNLTSKYDVRFLIGSPAYEEEKYYNRVWLVHKGKIEGSYDKVHLVPFGEYLPLAGLIEPFFGNLTKGVGNFSKATDPAPIGESGILICFESVFDDMSRHLCKQGARYLVNVSNDAWFKTWSTPAQHLRFACFRAVENRRYLLRSVNHGISAVVDPLGRIVSEIGLLQEGVMVRTITKEDYITFYTSYGPVLAYLWSFVAVIAALTSRRRDVKA